MNEFVIIAYPNGARKVIGHAFGGCAEGHVAKAVTHAKLRGEFVDVYRDGVHIAVVGSDGPVAS